MVEIVRPLYRSAWNAVGFCVSFIDPRIRIDARDSLKPITAIPIPDSCLQFEVTSKAEFYRLKEIKEQWTVDWVRHLPRDATLWDVGANIGTISLLAAEAGVAKVVAIEPSLLNIASLTANVLRNGYSDEVLVMPIGLGDKTNIAMLNMQNLNAGGALHSFGEIARLKPHHTNVPVARFGCMSWRADDLVQVAGVPFPTHMKIDVDGYELAVLDGAKEVLADPRLRGIQIEVMDFDGSENRRSEVVARLTASGFHLHAIHPHPSPMPRIADLHFTR